MAGMTSEHDQALLRLGQVLRDTGYRFTTITPESPRRVNERAANAEARSIRDVFGWSRPFSSELLPAEMISLLSAAQCVIDDGTSLRSCVRYSTSGDMIFVHSSFPTTGADAVFFGPDTYRYLALLRRLSPSASRVVDIGCGTGAGGLSIAAACGEVVLTDINENALRFARINARMNGITNVSVVRSDILRGVEGSIDLVVSNPPYLRDDLARTYRDGGGRFGEGLSVEIVRQSLDRLAAGGRLILYTASAIVGGQDTFLEAIRPLLSPAHLVTYQELDPDVFGEELDRPAYAQVDRIAVVGLDVVRGKRRAIPDGA